MAVTAESVTVEIIAKLDKATGDIKRLDSTFDTSTRSMQGAAKSLEASLERVGRTSTDSFNRVATGSRRATDTIERDAARIAAAQRNINRQYADIGTQLAGGQSPFLIAAQQAPQLADALQDVGGRGAKVAAFFAGPWGSAILAAGAILGSVLVPRLFDASSAADTMTAAQIDLARFVDSTTGAINRQTAAVQRLAAAQARQDAVEKGTRTHAAARGGAIGAVRDAAGVQAPTYAAGIRLPDSPITDPIKKRLRELADEAVRTRRPINDLVLDVRKLVGNRPEYAGLVKAITAQGGAAIEAAQGVERLKAEQRVLVGTSTAADRALLGLGQTTTGLIDKQVALATATTAVEKARARLALVEERGRAVQAGDARGLAAYRTDLTAATNSVKAAEAAERAAADAKRDGTKATRDAARAAKVAAREREQATRNEARAERELLGLRSELAGAQSDLTADRTMQDSFAKQRIELERAGRLDETAERSRRGELDEKEAAARILFINSIADARLAYVDRTRDIRTATDELEVATTSNSLGREVLEAQRGLADTLAKRKALDLKLLDLAIEERRLAAQRVVDLSKRGLASEQERKVAQLTLDALPEIKTLGKAQIEKENQGPLADYRDRIQESTSDMNRALEGVAVNGLGQIEDGFAGLITGADSVGDAFSRMADAIIADLARLAVQQLIILPLLEAIGAAGGGGIGGAVGGGIGGGGGGLAGAAGSFLKLLGIGARAAGGPVAAGKTYLVGERGPELLQMGGTAGTVIPNDKMQLARPAGIATMSSAGNTRAVQQRPQVTVMAPQQFDLRGVFMNEQTLRQLEVRNQQYAEAVGKGVLSTAKRTLPGAQARHAKLGTVGS